MSAIRWLRRQWRWRYLAARRWLFLRWHTRWFPSPLQRDYDSGDPVRRARVEALAAAIRAEISNEEGT